jgi:5'-deoxynucleotidase YfbR-like HD superfamily hydrolase|tara:strand:- start:2898 stop:3446 length:549 start_codon:yes stop_codon:yes gene_type:complete
MEKETRKMKEFTLLIERLKGGHVTRYHTVPEIANGQDVASHTWRAMIILTTLWPDISKNAIMNMMWHDIPEAYTGDIPATTKWGYPKLATALERAEDIIVNQLEIWPLDITEKEEHRIKVADMLELVLHCFRQMEMGNRKAIPVFKNGIEYLKNYDYDKEDKNIIAKILNPLITQADIWEEL